MAVRSKSEIYLHFDINGKRTTCKFCGKEAYKNPSRMPLHLTKCPKCPIAIRERMFAELPKSLCKTRPIKTNNSSEPISANIPDYDVTDIEVVNEEVTTDEVYFPNKYNFVSRKSDEQDICLTPRTIDDKPEDEFALFGNSVAFKLRNINNPRARAIAQYYINTVLFRAEMTNYNEEISLPAPQEFSLFDSIAQENITKENKSESFP